MKVSADLLKKGAEEILKYLGETSENAVKIAEILVRADMRGVSTHGTYLLTVISMRVKGGQLKLPTLPRVISDSGATAVIDGMDGIGMVAGSMAIELAIEKAKQYGVGMVLIRNTNNLGSLACYTQKAAEQGMIAIMSCNAAPAMAPWGGAEKFMGTNPIAISIPADGVGFTADMATSVVARGKIRKAARNGIDIPDNWALDINGVPTTDPNKALKGTLLPMGGPKGSALAMAVDIISGLLAGSGYGPLLKSFQVLEGPPRVGASCIVIDVSRFMALGKFKELMAEYSNSIKSLKKAEGFSEILMPGEIKYRKEQNSLKDGIELDPQLISALDELLVQAGSNIRLGENKGGA
jgi:LDH2 family malate/lactate/ureidoglycolate dehydrogenase